MKLVKLAATFLYEKKAQFLSSLLLISFGYLLINGVLQLNNQLENYAEKNLENIDLVVGAEGSPLQLILSSVLHADYPTGNISVKEAQFLAKNRLVKTAIPLLLGDSYKNHRIVGSTEEIFSFYELELAEGTYFHYPFEVVVGAAAAKKLNLKVGDEFYSSHGMQDEENMHQHDEFSFTVTGITKPTGSVADYLLFTSFESIWQVHDHGHEHEDEHEIAHSEHNEHTGHDHDHAHHNHSHDPWHSYEDKQITALLLKFKSPLAAVQLPRMINEKNNLQAANPVFEIKRLLKLIGFAISFVQLLAALILLISALTIYLSLYQMLAEKRFEFMMIRVLGASSVQLVLLPLLISLLLAISGTAFGWILSKSLLLLLSNSIENSLFLSISVFNFQPFELAIGVGILIVAILAALIPALRLMQIDPIKVLQEK